MSSDTASLDGQQLADLLEEAVRLRKDSGSDTPVIEAFHVVVDACRAELVAAQKAALAAADEAIQRLQEARASGNEEAIRRAHHRGADAVAHAQSVTDQVVEALIGLQNRLVEVSAPSVDRMLRLIAATEAILSAGDATAARDERPVID